MYVILAVCGRRTSPLFVAESWASAVAYARGLTRLSVEREVRLSSGEPNGLRLDCLELIRFGANGRPHETEVLLLARDMPRGP